MVAERDEARARIDELELHISALTVALEHTNNDAREREIARERERERERGREGECLQRLQRLQRDHTSSDGNVRTLRQAGEDTLSEVSGNADDSEDEYKSAFLGAVRSAGEIRFDCGWEMVDAHIIFTQALASPQYSHWLKIVSFYFLKHSRTEEAIGTTRKYSVIGSLTQSILENISE